MQEKTVRIDQIRFQQVLINLLSNAIKFSKKLDKVKIKVKINKIGLLADQIGKGEIVVQVKDTGVGISPVDLKNLFQPFFKSTDPNSLEINRNGHGLGLSICNQIVQAMNGTLEVSSVLGAGSTFTLRMKTDILEENIVEVLVGFCVSD